MQWRSRPAALAVGLAVGVVVLLLLGAAGGVFEDDADGPTAPGGADADGAGTPGGSVSDLPAGGSSADGDIVETVQYRRMPDRADRVEATIHYAIPENVESLRFRIPAGSYSVEVTDGFRETEDGAFVWDEHSEGPSVTIRHDVSESFRPEAADEHYAGGTADWAVVTRPQTNTNYTYYAPEPDVAYRLTVAGDGYAGEQMAYLGSYEEYSRIVDGERLVLVVPDAASPASEPGEILGSLAHASDRLRVGNRNDEVVVIAAPVGEVEWGPPGLAIGSDARVAADRSVDEPVNVWIHEYVHTRQYRDHRQPDGEAIADDASWLIEGSADYYGALFNHELGHTDFESFRNVLERGTREPAANAELADPGTWTADAEYEKGALVAAAIDLRLRTASDGEATLQQVLAEWNRQEQFEAADLEAAASAYGDASVRAFVEEHTRTDATPEPREREVHARHFDGAIAQFDYDATGDPQLSLTGPYRDGDLPPTIVTGETVAADVAVENVGDVAGPYRAVFVADGETVSLETDRLPARESETVTLEHTLNATGRVTLRAGDAARTVWVREPADPVVAELTAHPQRPREGQDVEVTATVHNPTDRPGTGTVAIEVDGDRIASERVRLSANGTTTVATTTSFDGPGEREVAAGDLAVTVSVSEGSLLDPLSGFGASSALLGVLLALGLLARGRS